MVKRRAETVIKRPADEVWARIGDFGDISWIPNAESWRMEGQDRIVTRKVWEPLGFVLVQRLVHHDDAERTYSYTLPGPLSFEKLIGPGKVANVLDGTLTVTPQGDNESVVTWDLETEDFLIEGTHAEYQHALETVKAELEG